MLPVASGRWGRFLRSVGVIRDDRIDVRRAALLSMAVTWLPLLALALMEGVAWNGGLDVPFLQDFLPYGQFLVAVPVLLLAEAVIGGRLVLANAELRRSDLLSAEDGELLEGLLRRAAGAWGGRSVNGGVLVVTIGITLVSLIGAREWLTGGWQVVGDRLTLPGWWYLLISLPLMRFLALRWTWRFLVWAWVLWRASKFQLHLRTSHPDRAGGLAFLGETQIAFSVIVFAFGVQLACLVADQVRYQGADLLAFRGYILAFVVISVIAVLLPLVAFLPQFARVRFDRLLFMSGRGYDGAVVLESKLQSGADRALPDAAVSGLADYGALYENARLMRRVPMEWRHAGAIVLAAVIPFVPLVFLAMPAQEVVRTLVRLLI
jgi:hypothetical protein